MFFMIFWMELHINSNIWWYLLYFTIFWWNMCISRDHLTKFAYFLQSSVKIRVFVAIFRWNCVFQNVLQSLDKICEFFRMFSRKSHFYIIFWPHLYEISNTLTRFLNFFLSKLNIFHQSFFATVSRNSCAFAIKFFATFSQNLQGLSQIFTEVRLFSHSSFRCRFLTKFSFFSAIIGQTSLVFCDLLTKFV